MIFYENLYRKFTNPQRQQRQLPIRITVNDPPGISLITLFRSSRVMIIASLLLLSSGQSLLYPQQKTTLPFTRSPLSWRNPVETCTESMMKLAAHIYIAKTKVDFEHIDPTMVPIVEKFVSSKLYREIDWYCALRYNECTADGRNTAAFERVLDVSVDLSKLYLRESKFGFLLKAEDSVSKIIYQTLSSFCWLRFESIRDRLDTGK